MIGCDIGEMQNILARSYEVSSGSVVMYYPEVNQIINRRLDPISKTPAFKSAFVSISPMEP